MPRIPLSEKMSGVSKLAAATSEGYREMTLDIDLLVPSVDNFYPVEGIEQLADNMLDAGQIEPVVIGIVDGENRITSGHRRYFAMKRNVERGYIEFRKVRCSVKKMSQPMFMLTLASANAFTRKLDDATLIRQAEVMEKAIRELEESGELTVEGRKRDYMAGLLGISATKLAQVNKIRSSLVEEGRAALESGEINFSKAYETAKLEPDRQRMVIGDKSLLSANVREMTRNITITADVRDSPAGDETAVEGIRDGGAGEIHVKLEPDAVDECRDCESYQRRTRDYLCAYKDWGVWFEEPRIGAVYYRRVFQDGAWIIAVEYKRTAGDPIVTFHSGEKGEPFHPAPWMPDSAHMADMLRVHLFDYIN